MRLLHIIATPRGNKSRTLAISQKFLDALKKKHPGTVVDELDLFRVNMPPISGNTVIAKYALMGGDELDQAAEGSWGHIERFVSKFLANDLYLISTPMWNFGLPYPLKHYIDTIMQAGYLFQFTDDGARGLTKDKKMVCITSRGRDYSPGSSISDLDYLERYLRGVFGVAGIKDIRFINAQPMDVSPDITAAEIEKASKEAEELAKVIF